MKTTHFRRFIPLLTLLLALPHAHAQEGGAPAEVVAQSQAEPDPGLISPAETLVTFDTAMEAYLLDRSDSASLATVKSCFDFSQLELSTAQTDAANNLFRVMSRIEEIDRRKIPKPDDSTRFVYFPREGDAKHQRLSNRFPDAKIELVKNAIGEWRISAETVAISEAMFLDFKSLDTVTDQVDVSTSIGQRVRDAMPPALFGTFLSVAYWQWIAIFLVIFAGLAIDLIVRSVLSSVWYRIDKKRDGPSAEKGMLKKTVRPFGLVAAAAFWLAMINIGGISGTALVVLLLAIRVILSVGSVWAAWRLTDLVADFLMRKAAATDNRYDDLLIPLFQRTLKILIGAVGIIYIAKALNIDVLPLLTGLGIGGLAVAFAAKDTIENFFGSVAVIVDQPFEVGDWIVVEGVEGTVEELGFRSTRIRTFYNSLVTVPNAMLVRATVDNYGKRKYRRWSTTLNLTYDTPPDTIEAFCEGIRELVRLHPYMRKDMFHVYLNSFGAHSLDVMLYVFFDCPDWAIELRERQRLMLDIIRLADRMGVAFAFPTQTLELKQVDPNQTHTPGEVPETSDQRNALKEGVRAARELTEHQPWKTNKPGGVVFRVSREDDELEMRGESGE